MPPISPGQSRDTGSRLGQARARTRSQAGRRARRAVVSMAAVAGLLACWAAAPGAQASAGQSRSMRPQVRVRPDFPIFTNLPAPVSIAKCQADFGVRCYTPLELRVAYDLNPLYHRGLTGHGRTIVIPTPFGSPTIRNDLKVFDKQWGIPDTNLRIIQFGHIPPYDPRNPTRIEWAAGTTIMVEYAHAVAPGARIVIAETPVSETAGAHGFPDLMQAQQSLINSGIGDVFELITDTPENTFPGFPHGNYSSLLNLRYAFKDALTHHVTEVVASGDSGATGFMRDGTQFPYQVTNWPATDPLVTAVGATHITLNSDGERLQPDTVWNDGSQGAGGGGLSAIFARPAYQSGVASVVGNHRGIPDISLNGAVTASCWVYLTFGGLGGTGWNLFNGTTESAPMFAGIIALADQLAGHRLGLINPALYRMGAMNHHSTGIIDVTLGNNTFGGVTGFNAVPGYDLASGWGTLDAAKFVRALVRLS
jgi:subtilase family serine protease